MARTLKSRRPQQLSVNHERWLVSYADFITLLFAFFVVMYSVSQVNEEKFRVLSDTLLDVFNEPRKSLEPIQIGDPELTVTTTPIEGQGDNNQQTVEGVGDGTGAFTETSELPSANSEVASGAMVDGEADAHFNDIEQALKNRFANLLSEQVMHIDENEFWLEVELNTKSLFAPGSAEPSFAAETVFDELADILNSYDNAIEIEGFTDNIPINTPVYPSNWELSSARAASVVQIMAQGGVAPKRMAAIGYGQFRPIADNSTAGGREKNRRVVVKIAKEQYQKMLESDRAYQYFQSKKNAILNDTTLTAREKNQQLIELGSSPTNPSIRKALIDASKVTPPDVANEERSNESDDSLEPVHLEDGDILFTNDPERATGRGADSDQ